MLSFWCLGRAGLGLRGGVVEEAEVAPVGTVRVWHDKD